VSTIQDDDVTKRHLPQAIMFGKTLVKANNKTGNNHSPNEKVQREPPKIFWRHLELET
jgi:hypothetical protein